MPGNLRKKLKRGGPTERDYLLARKQIIWESRICAGCHEAIDLTLPPICVRVNTAGFTVENAHDIPARCEPDCKHPRKANPWSASADHVIPVEKLPPGSSLLTSKKNLVAMHKICNQRKGSGAAIDRPKFISSGDWF
jgi:hypothetical protein